MRNCLGNSLLAGNHVGPLVIVTDLTDHERQVLEPHIAANPGDQFGQRRLVLARGQAGIAFALVPEHAAISGSVLFS